MNFTRPFIKCKINKLLTVFILLVVGLLNFAKVNATERTVSSIFDLQNAINNAGNGDIIILTNGTYLNNILNISTSNITVKAATPGGVFLNGTNSITISGNYVTFSGFQFTSGNIGTGTLMRITGSYNVVTQLNFSDYYASKYIQINDGTQFNEITFCNL